MTVVMSCPSLWSGGRGRLEALAGVAGVGVGPLAVGVGVGGGEVRAELDGGDVVDPGPAQPVVQVRRLEVLAERRGTPGAVDGAGVDDGRLLAGEQAGVTGLRVEAEDHAG